MGRDVDADVNDAREEEPRVICNHSTHNGPDNGANANGDAPHHEAMRPIIHLLCLLVLRRLEELLPPLRRPPVSVPSTSAKERWKKGGQIRQHPTKTRQKNLGKQKCVRIYYC